MRNLSDKNEWTEERISRAVFEGASPSEYRGLTDAFTLAEIKLLTDREDISPALFARAVDCLNDKVFVDSNDADFDELEAVGFPEGVDYEALILAEGDDWI